MPTRILAALLLAASIGFTGCGRADEATPPGGDGVVAVETATAELTPVPNQYRFTGSVAAAKHIPLATRLAGRVAELNVEEGDAVEEGDVLLRIDDTDLQAQKRQAQAGLRQATAQLETARADLNRFETLADQGSATPKELENVRTAFESASGQVESLEARIAEVDEMLTYATIRAPIAGVITDRHIEAGSMTAPGRPLLVLESASDLEVHAFIPERELQMIKVGDAVHVRVDAAGRTVPGSITDLTPSADAASRRFRAQIALDKTASTTSPRVLPGMYATVYLQKGTSPRIMVPESALVRRGQLDGVYAISDDGSHAVLRWIRLGKARDGRVEVLSGLAAGDRYVVGASAQLTDGRGVTIR